MLWSLGCRDKAETLEMLYGIDISVPAAVTLVDKLEHGLVDYAAEMRSDEFLDIDEE